MLRLRAASFKHLFQNNNYTILVVARQVNQPCKLPVLLLNSPLIPPCRSALLDTNRLYREKGFNFDSIIEY